MPKKSWLQLSTQLAVLTAIPHIVDRVREIFLFDVMEKACDSGMAKLLMNFFERGDFLGRSTGQSGKGICCYVFCSWPILDGVIELGEFQSPTLNFIVFLFLDVICCRK